MPIRTPSQPLLSVATTVLLEWAAASVGAHPASSAGLQRPQYLPKPLKMQCLWTRREGADVAAQNGEGAPLARCGERAFSRAAHARAIPPAQVEVDCARAYPSQLEGHCTRAVLRWPGADEKCEIPPQAAAGGRLPIAAAAGKGRVHLPRAAERVQHRRGIAHHHVRRLRQQHVQPGRRERGGRKVALRLGALDVALEPCVIPHVQVGRAVGDWHAMRTQVAVCLAVQSINQPATHIKPRQRRMPIERELPIVKVGGAHEHQTVLRDSVRSLHERCVVGCSRIGLVRQAFDRIRWRGKLVGILAVRHRRVSLAGTTLSVATDGPVRRRTLCSEGTRDDKWEHCSPTHAQAARAT